MQYGLLIIAFQLASSTAFKLASSPKDEDGHSTQSDNNDEVIDQPKDDAEVTDQPKNIVEVKVDVRSDTRTGFLDFEHVQLESAWKDLYEQWLCSVRQCCQACQDSMAQVDETLFKVVLRVFEEECDWCNYGKKIEPTDADLAADENYRIDDSDYERRATKCLKEVRRSDVLTFPAIIHALYKSIRNNHVDMGRGSDFPITNVKAVWEIRNKRRECAKTETPHTCDANNPLDLIEEHLGPTQKISKKFRECDEGKDSVRDKNGIEQLEEVCTKKSDQSCKPSEPKMATVAFFCKAAMGYYCAHRVPDFGAKDR